MPAKLDRCVKKVQKKGKDKSSAYAICSKSTGWKVGKGSKKKKKKWVKRKESAVSEGVSKRRSHPNAEYTDDIKYIITKWLGFIPQKTKSTSHRMYKREGDGAVVGLVKKYGNSIIHGHRWKGVLADVFWWADPGEREELWTLARGTKGQDPALQPPPRTGSTGFTGVTAREKNELKSFKQFFEKRYYNDTLHPKFWTDDNFNEEVLNSIIEIVDEFIKDDDHITPEMIEDIQLTGSLANFNYSDHSDLDIHILLDFAIINKDETIVKRALDGKRFIWNLRHNIEFHNHEIELYFQDIHEPHVASGLFSIQDNRWIKKPVHDPPEIDQRDVEKKAEQFRTEIELMKEALNEVDDKQDLALINKRAKKLKDKLMRMRQKGLASKGEYSVENLAFKNLRNDETIAELNSLIIQSYDLMFGEQTVVEKKKRKKRKKKKEKKGVDEWLLSLVHALFSTNPSHDPKPQRYPAGI